MVEGLAKAILTTGAIIVVFILVCMALNGVRILIRNKWFTEKDFFGDKIKGWWVHSVEPGARDLRHSFVHDRCNACGQKNLCVLEYKDYFGATSTPGKPTMLRPDNTRDWLCGSCGCKYNTSLYEVEVKVLRQCTDPIPELRRPATHGCVLPDGLEVRLHVCKTCDGSKFVSVPSSVNTGELWGEWEKARCPDCYRADDSAPAATMSARRRAIEHTKEKNAKVSAEEADRLKEPREDIISQL